MLTALFITCVLTLPQAADPVPSLPYDQVIGLEITPDDPVLIEGRGPSVVVEYDVEFSGTLHVWTTSEVDLVLRVEDAGGERLGEDEESGGGMTPYVKLKVESDTGLRILVGVAEKDANGEVMLHLVTAPETEETRAAVEMAEEELQAIQHLRAAGELEMARMRLVELFEGLDELEGGETSQEVEDLLVSISEEGFQSSLIKTASSALQRIHDMRERSLPELHADLLQAKLALALARKQLGDLRGALKLEERVHTVWERLLPGDHADLLNAKQGLAGTRAQLGDLDGALELFECVHAARERLCEPDDMALLQAKSNLAVIHVYLRHYRQASELLDYVHRAMERSLAADHPDLLSVKLNLAGTRAELGDLDGALELEEYVHDVRERSLPADHPDLLTVKQSLGATRMSLGDLESALELAEYVHSARSRSLPEDHPALLDAKQNLAAALSRLRDHKGALVLSEYVHEALSRLLPADHPYLLDAKQSLAAIRKELGDLDGALELEEYVHDARKSSLPEEHPALLSIQINVAVTRGKLGDLEGALELEEHVHAIWDQSLPPRHPNLLGVKQNLAGRRRRLGDLEGALELEEHIHELLIRSYSDDHPDLLVAKDNLATTRFLLDDIEGALELMEHVHEVWDRLLADDHPDLLGAKQDLAVFRKAQGDSTGAFELALSLLRGQVLLAESLAGESPRLARALAKREFVRLSSAIVLSRCGGTQVSDVRGRAIFDALESLRAVSLDAVDVTAECAGDQDLESIRRAVAAVRRRAAAAVASPPQLAEEIGGWRRELVKLGEERDRLQKELRQELLERGHDFDPPTADRVARGLDPRAAFISFLRHYDSDAGEDALLALVLTPRDPVRLIELGPCSELEALAGEWRDLIGRPLGSAARLRGVGVGAGEVRPVLGDENSLDDIGRTLRERILDPCLAAVGEGPPAVLHVVPDDFLLTLPLGALPGKDGLPVREEIPLHLEVSARRIVTPRSPTSGKGVLLAFGEVDYDAEDVGSPGQGIASAGAPAKVTRDQSLVPGQFEPLKETGTEIEQVSELYGRCLDGEPLIFRKGQARKSAFADRVKLARFLHIATHGWFAPIELKSMLDYELGSRSEEVSQSLDQAERLVSGYLPEALCGLAFAGANHGADEGGLVPGILTAEELATLDLSQCELAVLSACETNVGIRRAGQGIQSLQTALHAAGARTAITSLWKVDDAATRKLMQLFYTYLWVEKMPVADALWKAKCDLRKAGHPVRDWAAWVLSGDPD